MINILKILETSMRLPANLASIPYLNGSTTEKTADGNEEATRTTVRSIPVIPNIDVASYPAKKPKINLNISPDIKCISAMAFLFLREHPKAKMASAGAPAPLNTIAIQKASMAIPRIMFRFNRNLNSNCLRANDVTKVLFDKTIGKIIFIV